MMEIEFLKSAFREKDYPPPDKPEIAFAGKSNVGKSSLINVLVNRKGIARTSSKPGRTQAINFFSVEDRLFFDDLPQGMRLLLIRSFSCRISKKQSSLRSLRLGGSSLNVGK